MKRENLILDFSGVYSDAGWPEMLLSEGETPVLLDLRAAEGTSCFCDKEGAAAIREALLPYSAEGVHWIDGGDYHYVTCFFAEKIKGPYTLLHLDHHTDYQVAAFPGVLSCGNWVRELLDHDRHLRGVITLGAAPEPVWLGSPDPSGPLYVSLDKDVLSLEWAHTDWDQGDWSLSQLIRTLERYWSGASEVIGIDICGEAPVQKGGRAKDWAVNAKTNLEIQRFINNYFKY